MLRFSRFRISTISVLALALLGCGRARTKVDVTGTVTYQGKPIDLGNIKFDPIDKKLQPDGNEIRGGVYHVTLPIGPALVSISGAKKVGETKASNTPNGPGRAKYEEFVPKKYSREPDIIADIKADTSRLDFDLK
jgi:hypothetical protein